jgi:monothiol glutaredoxin
MLYMKGTPAMPRCGFSARVVEILDQLGRPYGAVDVLADSEKWDLVNEREQWPTMPMVFIGGEFIGGCDITTEMYQAGELQTKVEEAFAARVQAS